MKWNAPAFAFLAGLGTAAHAQEASLQELSRAADQPNVVIILADDLGNADLGYRGSKIKTPNIDTLAKGGCGSSPTTDCRSAPRRVRP